MSDLRSKVIRLAHANPELRSDLLPLLKEASHFMFEDSSTYSKGIRSLDRSKEITQWIESKAYMEVFLFPLLDNLKMLGFEIGSLQPSISRLTNLSKGYNWNIYVPVVDYLGRESEVEFFGHVSLYRSHQTQTLHLGYAFVTYIKGDPSYNLGKASSHLELNIHNSEEDALGSLLNQLDLDLDNYKRKMFKGLKKIQESLNLKILGEEKTPKDESSSQPTFPKKEKPVDPIAVIEGILSKNGISGEVSKNEDIYTVDAHIDFTGAERMAKYSQSQSLEDKMQAVVWQINQALPNLNCSGDWWWEIDIAEFEFQVS